METIKTDMAITLQYWKAQIIDELETLDYLTESDIENLEKYSQMFSLTLFEHLLKYSKMKAKEDEEW